MLKCLDSKAKSSESSERVLDDINRTIMEAIRKGDLEIPNKFRVLVRAYEEAGVIEKGLSLTFRYLLNDLLPFAGTVIMQLDHNKIIDAVIPNKAAAGQVKGLLSTLTGKKSGFVINPAKINEAKGRN